MRRMFSEAQLALLIINALANLNDGTIDKVLGLDENGNPVKGEVSGGTQLYKHDMKNSEGMNAIIITTVKDAMTSWSDCYEKLNGENIIAGKVNGPTIIEKVLGIKLGGFYGISSNSSISLTQDTNLFSIGTFVSDTVTPL